MKLRSGGLLFREKGSMDDFRGLGGGTMVNVTCSWAPCGSILEGILASKIDEQSNKNDMVLDPEAIEAANKIAMELLQQEHPIKNNKELENLIFSTGEKYQQSSKQQAPTQSGKKKRGKKNRKNGK